MVIELIFGLAILGIVAYVIFRVIGSVTIGALLVAAVFLASYLLTGGIPELANVPIIGQFIPGTTGQAIAVIKDTIYSADIIGVSKSSDGNLLVTLVNTGRLDLNNFNAYVNGNPVEILNDKDSLKTGEVVVFELNWKDDFTEIVVITDQTQATYDLNVGS